MHLKKILPTGLAGGGGGGWGDGCADGGYIKWNGPYSDTLSSLSDTRGKDQIMLISELFVVNVYYS